ncbi:MAG: prepilin-type N-terminal cleavage/methylation domain-containing protein [Phycisphaerales bacterium]|nr:MAG: prepilin-type N-terminal cleavage/methylation domain-containing protein [Phycisphaerales bacterium]
MGRRCKQSGLTLVEIVVVILVITLLASFGLPAVRALLSSFESRGSAKSMISAALASARAMAAKEQRYAGLRFQKVYDPCDPDPVKAAQYMIFIVHEEPRKMGNLTVGFRAVEGVEPIKLPDSVGVTDLMYRPGLLSPAGDGVVDDDAEINNPNVLRDMTAFSIIFSPSGKLVIHDVRVRNRDGRTEGTETVDTSRDDIFNTLTKITDPVNPVGAFIQDDYPSLGFGRETSRKSLVLYDRTEFTKAYKSARPWSRYLWQAAREETHINLYTGTLILPD